MSRPLEDVRIAVARAALALAAEKDGFTWRELTERACVSHAAARKTVQNMVRSGHLEQVGNVKVAHSRRWMALWAPTPALQIGAGQANG